MCKTILAKVGGEILPICRLRGEISVLFLPISVRKDEERRAGRYRFLLSGHVVLRHPSRSGRHFLSVFYERERERNYARRVNNRVSRPCRVNNSLEGLLTVRNCKIQSLQEGGGGCCTFTSTNRVRCSSKQENRPRSYSRFSFLSRARHKHRVV